MSWRRFTLNGLKWLNWTLVIPLMLLSMLVGFILYSAPGLKVTLWLVQHMVPGFSVGSSEGSLLGGSTLHQLKWQQADNSLVIKKLSLQFDNRCLLKLAVCADHIDISGLTGNWYRAVAEVSAEPTNATFLLPLPVSVTRLTVDDSQFNFDGNQLQWQHLSMGISAWGNKLQLNSPLWRQINLQLATAIPTSNTNVFEYSPAKLTDISAPLQLFVDRFKLEDITVARQQQHYRLQDALLSLQWQGHELNVIQLDVTHALGIVQGAARLSSSANYPLQASVTAEITAGEFAGQRLKLRASGDLAALDLQLSASGNATLHAQARLDLLSPALPHQVQLTSDHLQWPLADTNNQMTAASLAKTQLSLSGSLLNSEISGTFSVMANNVPPMTVNLAGSVNQHSLTLESLQIATLGGFIEAPLSLSWQQGIHWQADTRLQAIQPGLFWTDYHGELNGLVKHQGGVSLDGSWQLTLQHIDVSGQLRDYLLTLNGSAVASDPKGHGQYVFQSSGLQLRHGDNSLQLTGDLAQDWHAAVQLSITDLGTSVANASGALSGKLTLDGPRAEPRLKVDVSGNNLSFEQAKLTSMQLQGALQFYSKYQWQTDLTLTALDGSYQQQTIEQLLLQLSGNSKQHQLALTLDAAEHKAELNLQGSLIDESWQGSILQGRIDSLLGDWQLDSPTSLSVNLAEQAFTMAEHCWQQATASLCLLAPLQLSRQRAMLEFRLSQLQLAQLSALLPAGNDLQGNVDVNAKINWQQTQPINAELSLTAGAGAYRQQLSSPLTLDWQSVNWQLSAKDNEAQNHVAIRFNQQATLNAEVNVANLDHPVKPLGGSLALNQFAIDFLQPLLGDQNELSGALSSDIKLAGTLQQPLFYGELTLQRSRLKGKLAPVDIDNADIVLALNGDTAKLDGQIHTPQGEIRLQGDANWQQIDNWLAVLDVKGDELRLQVPQASLLVAPDVQLTLKPGYTRVSGTVHIPNANISIDSLPQSAIELSDDLILLDTDLQPVATQNKRFFTFESDINLQLGRQVRLSAFGLKTRLSGNLKVRQQAEQPLRLNGEVTLQDGIFRAYGQDLLIRKGSMTFNGPADQPYLNVEAIRNPDNMEDNVIAGIRVNGPADEPSIVIFSEPAKAQASALAYLLMGRDLDAGSGSAGNAVTTSLIGMTLSSSSKVVGEIGEAFGLRDLTLDTAGAGDNSQVTVSGYLSRDIQLKYGYGIFNAVGEFTLRYRLMRRLYLEAVSGLDNAVDLLYKFEFD